MRRHNLLLARELVAHVEKVEPAWSHLRLSRWMPLTPRRGEVADALIRLHAEASATWSTFLLIRTGIGSRAPLRGLLARRAVAPLGKAHVVQARVRAVLDDVGAVVHHLMIATRRAVRGPADVRELDVALAAVEVVRST